MKDWEKRLKRIKVANRKDRPRRKAGSKPYLRRASFSGSLPIDRSKPKEVVTRASKCDMCSKKVAGRDIQSKGGISFCKKCMAHREGKQ